MGVTKQRVLEVLDLFTWMKWIGNENKNMKNSAGDLCNPSSSPRSLSPASCLDTMILTNEINPNSTLKTRSRISLSTEPHLYDKVA